MEIESEQILPAQRQAVWALLNDPLVLRDCIPGCESLTVDDQGQMAATVAVALGPIKARFSGSVRRVDVTPSSSFSLLGEGSGGIAGFAKGRTDVTLEDHAEGTLLKYRVRVEIGGKLAQLGSRLVASTSKKLSKQFFDHLTEKICGSVAPSTSG